MRKPAFVTQFEHGARRRRFQLLVQLLETLPRPIRILDVGGQIGFWETLNHTQLGEIHVTLMNLFPQPSLPANFCSHLGDARSMRDYAPDDFDLVISNSVIGHVGSFCDQRRMADEIRRVGKRYFIQTPNHYFPVDWRTLIPLFHFLPLKVRAGLLYSLPITSFGRLKPYSSALQWASCVRNLKYSELQTLFPEAAIVGENVFGFTKSFMAYHGFRLHQGDEAKPFQKAEIV